MSAAVLQGVPVATFHIDFWLDRPARQYMRVVRLALAQGAKMVRNTVVELSDGTLLNFIFEITGLRSFAIEIKKACKIRFHGQRILVMPLESIRASKAAIMRPKDEAHIFHLDRTIQALHASKREK